MKICIYCASSKAIPSTYFELSKKTAELLAGEGHHLIYGGGARGLMGQIADTYLEKGGEVTGVIPGFMKEVEWDHPGVKNMHVVKDMIERKQMFFDLSDLLMALPGGVGTLEELSEALSLKRLGLIRHPIIIANFNGFYDEFLIYLNKMVDQDFMGEKGRDLWTEIQKPEEIIDAITNCEPWPLGISKSESF